MRTVRTLAAAFDQTTLGGTNAQTPTMHLDSVLQSTRVLHTPRFLHESVSRQCHCVAASDCGESLAAQVGSCAGWAASDDCTSHRRTSDVLGEGHRRGRGVAWGNALKMGRSMEESQPKAAARRIIAPWSDGCTKTPLDGGDRKDLQIVGWDDEHRNVARGRAKVPPEGQQQSLISAGNTLVLAFVVAGNAAKQALFASEQSQASACDEERAGAIDLWIARCPVDIPETILVGIKAIIQASSGRRL